MWSNLNDPCIFREISQQETATFLWRKFASGRSKGGRRMALCLAKLRSAKGEEKPSRKGTCKSWGSTKQQQNTWVFSPGIAIDRGYPRGSFHLKIREVRGWFPAAVGSNWGAGNFCYNWEVRGYMFLHWLYCWHVKKGQEKGNRKWVMYNIIWKREFFWNPSKISSNSVNLKSTKKTIWTKR